VSYLHVLRSWAARVAAVVLVSGLVPAVAQVPIPVQEQVQLFNALPPAQQQALIRELQRSLPPAQRQAIIQMLQEGGGGDTLGVDEIDPTAAGILEQGLPTEDEGADLFGLGLGSLEEVVPRLRARSTLVVEFALRSDAPPVTPEEQERIEGFRERLARGNPYQLDNSGRLYLPGVPAIELAGLDAEQATVRIRTEPQLDPFSVTLTFLRCSRICGLSGTSCSASLDAAFRRACSTCPCRPTT
jgi:hypothetical protein